MQNRAPSYWKKACLELSRNDKVMAKVIKRYPKSFLSGRGDAFMTVCRAIIGQQISMQAAESIWQKFEKTCAPLEPQRISRKRISTLTACGLSQQKALCIKELAVFFTREKINANYWKKIDEQEIKNRLCSIKGIGKWTFEMFAIFYLRHPDILPLNDLGLLKAVQKEYGYTTLPSKDQLALLEKRWHPWCTVATWYLWRSVDPEPVTY